MSEFCAHVEWGVISHADVTYAQAQALHRRSCQLCAAGADDEAVNVGGHEMRFKCRLCGRVRPISPTLCRCHGQPASLVDDLRARVLWIEVVAGLAALVWLARLLWYR